MADNIRDQLFPDYHMGVHGVIISNNVVRLILHEVDAKLYSKNLYKNFYFISSHEVYQTTLYFAPSVNDRYHFLKENLLVNSDKTNNKFPYHSPSLIRYKVDRLIQNTKRETVNCSKAKADMILTVMIGREGINLSGANLEKVFPENLREVTNKLFDKEKILPDNLARYLFQESFIQVRTAVKVGSTHAGIHL